MKWLAAKTLRFFSSVDCTKEPDFFKRFLDEGNKNPGIIASKPVFLAGLHLSDHAEFPEAAVGRAWGSRDWPVGLLGR